MPVKFWHTSLRFWFCLSYLITTVCPGKNLKQITSAPSNSTIEVTLNLNRNVHKFHQWSLCVFTCLFLWLEWRKKREFTSFSFCYCEFRITTCFPVGRGINNSQFPWLMTWRKKVSAYVMSFANIFF